MDWVKKQMGRQDQISCETVTDRQMFFDQLDDTLATIGSYLNVVKRGKAKSSRGRVLSSMCATSLNCFGLSSNERHSEKDKKALVLASNKLDEWIKNKNLEQSEYDVISPMLKFIHCCVEKDIDLDKNGIGNLDNPSAYGKNFTQKNVSKGASQYLASGHVIRDRVKRYNKNFQYIDQMHDDKFKKFGGKNAKVFNDTQLPSSDDIYRTSAENPKYRDYSKKNCDPPSMDIDSDGDGHVPKNHNQNQNDDDSKCNGGCNEEISKNNTEQSMSLMPELESALGTIESYVKFVKNGDKNSKNARILSSSCDNNVKSFGVWTNEKHYKNDTKALDLASRKLDEWTKNQKFKELIERGLFDLISPMLNFIRNCIQRSVDLDDMVILRSDKQNNTSNPSVFDLIPPLNKALKTIERYLCALKKNEYDRVSVLLKSCEMQLKHFGTLSNGIHSKKDKKTLELTSEKLGEWDQKLERCDKDAISPLLNFVWKCFDSTVDVDKNWNVVVRKLNAHSENSNSKQNNKNDTNTNDTSDHEMELTTNE